MSHNTRLHRSEGFEPVASACASASRDVKSHRVGNVPAQSVIGGVIPILEGSLKRDLMHTAVASYSNMSDRLPMETISPPPCKGSRGANRGDRA